MTFVKVPVDTSGDLSVNAWCRYLASAAASARQHERAGGTAGLQPLRPDPATCAAALKKPAHGIPARNVAAKRPADTYGAGLALAEAKRNSARSVPAQGPHLQPPSGISNSANHRESGAPGAGSRARGRLDEGEEMVVLEDDGIDFEAAPRSGYGCGGTPAPLTEANRRAAQLVRERGKAAVRSTTLATTLALKQCDVVQGSSRCTHFEMCILVARICC